EEAAPAAKEPDTPAASPEQKAPKAKRQPNASFMRPQQPDTVLAAVVGATPLPRTQITKLVWAYIKKNGLQDTQNKRMINADQRLQDVFGGKKQVSMFEMNKLVNQHLTPA
ncbi:MAG: SWIB/MDM2 domain-containing protein, partial [Candidatus Latescibacterota bacterium]